MWNKMHQVLSFHWIWAIYPIVAELVAELGEELKGFYFESTYFFMSFVVAKHNKSFHLFISGETSLLWTISLCIDIVDIHSCWYKKWMVSVRGANEAFYPATYQCHYSETSVFKGHCDQGTLSQNGVVSSPCYWTCDKGTLWHVGHFLTDLMCPLKTGFTIQDRCPCTVKPLSAAPHHAAPRPCTTGGPSSPVIKPGEDGTSSVQWTWFHHSGP